MKIHEVEKKCILNKYDKTQDPMEWMNKYENECARYNFMRDENKIEALRFFLSGPAMDWYDANLKKMD